MGDLTTQILEAACLIAIAIGIAGLIVFVILYRADREAEREDRKR